MEATEMPINRWMDKNNIVLYVCMCVMEYYSAIKKNEMSFA